MNKCKYIIMPLTVFLSAAFLLSSCTLTGTDSPAVATTEVGQSDQDSVEADAASTDATEPESTGVPDTQSATTQAVSEATLESPPAQPPILMDETSAMILEIVDLVAVDLSYGNNERDAAAAHPEEFAKITSLGEVALPYLQDIITVSDDNDTQARRRIAAYASYTIKPELYELIFTSPDVKYTLKASPENFFGLYLGIDYNNLRLIDNTTGEIIYDKDPDKIYIHVSVCWSPESSYCAITYGDYNFFMITDVLDVRNGTYIHLDNSKEIINTLRKSYTLPQEVIFDRDKSCFREWVMDKKIKIGVEFRYEEGIYSNSKKVGMVYRYLNGWYVFDLTEGKITESDIDFISNQ